MFKRDGIAEGWVIESIGARKAIALMQSKKMKIPSTFRKIEEEIWNVIQIFLATPKNFTLIRLMFDEVKAQDYCTFSYPENTEL